MRGAVDGEAMTDGKDYSKRICKCGHTQWDHACSLKGEYGPCQKELVKNWKWCECKMFDPQAQATPAPTIEIRRYTAFEWRMAQLFSAATQTANTEPLESQAWWADIQALKRLAQMEAAPTVRIPIVGELTNKTRLQEITMDTKNKPLPPTPLPQPRPWELKLNAVDVTLFDAQGNEVISASSAPAQHEQDVANYYLIRDAVNAYTVNE